MSPTPAPHTSERYLRLLAVGLPLVVSAVYWRLGARTPTGAPMLPLDDAYIHLQYAWQAAHGQFMQYNPGDPATSGATSLLYLLLLAGGFAAGLSKDAMPLALGLAGAALFVFSTVTLADLTRRAAGLLGVNAPLATAAAIGLFAGSGWMAWSFLSGMETGLLIALVCLTLWAQVARRRRLMAVASGLAVLTRPEAALLPLLLMAAEALWPVSGETGRRRSTAGLLAALGLAVVPPAINYFYTGSFSASGMQAKALFTLVPFQWSAVVSGLTGALLEIWLRLLGGLTTDGHWHILPLLQVAGAAGVVLSARSPQGRRLAFICAGWLALGTAATATLQTATWHHFRYQMPFYPALVLLGGLALAALAARWRRGAAGPLLLLAAVAAWSGSALIDFAREYARDTRTAATMQLPLALWLHDHTPAAAQIAVHDIGIVRYFSERATLDVVGLTTAGLAAAYRNGPGSLFEALAREQPAYYAVYPDRAPPYFGTGSAAALLGRELFRVQVTDYSRVTSAGDTQVVTQPTWATAALAATPQQPSTQPHLAGLTLSDSLNVADLLDEQAHAYGWWNQGEAAGFPTDARVMVYRQDPALTVADGGRLLTGGERLTLRVTPATPLLLVARLHQTADMVLAVTVNGSELGEWRLPAIPGEWLESTFAIAPAYLTGTTAEIELTVTDAPADARYSPFYYWAYQGQATVPPASAPPQPLAAAFGTVAALVGFEIPVTEVSPGAALDLTLYWQALAPERANYKMFVHLMNPADDTAAGIVAQVDAAPLAGTDPFWVWPAGATRGEHLRLDVPADTSAGTYLLLAGLYNADTGERLAVSGAPDFGAARVVLAEVAVR